MRKSTKILGALGASAVVLSTAGVAYAYWTTTGSGNGTGSAAATAGNLTLDGPVSAVTGLVPGSSIDVPITASNASTTTSLAATTLGVSLFAVDADHSACLTLADGAKPTILATSPAAQVVVAPSGSAPFGKVTISLPNSATVDQGDCKSAVFTFHVAAS
jgi:hypothetical protein